MSALAHPHVFVDTGLEIRRDVNNKVIGITHRWRFDELFSSSVLLDFDNNGDGNVDETELLEVGQTILTNIKEFDYFTAWRFNGKVLAVDSPKNGHAVFGEDQILEMELHMDLPEPVDAAAGEFKVSVSDPSFYVAFDIAESNITFAGGNSTCKPDLTEPDFDELYAQGAETLTEAFFNQPDKPELSDEYYPWIKIKC